MAAKFIVEEDAEALEKELREAFRLYDKEGGIALVISNLFAAQNKIRDKQECNKRDIRLSRSLGIRL